MKILLAMLVTLSVVLLPAAQDTKPGPLPNAVAPGTSRAWALLTCSVLFERNGDRHDLLAGEVLTDKAKEEARKVLEKDWDITNRTKLDSQLGWLKGQGHRVEMEKGIRRMSLVAGKALDDHLRHLNSEDERKVARAMWKHAARVKELKGGLLGWDLARYVALCRWGYAAGYLSESAAWKLIEPVAQQLQRAYASWEELGEVYCIGRDLWRPETNEKTEAAFEALKVGEKSPWKTTPWDLMLGKLDKPEVPAPTK